MQTILDKRVPRYGESKYGSDRNYRGIVDANGNLYIWNGSICSHNLMVRKLGLDKTKYFLYLDKRGGVEYYYNSIDYDPEPITQEIINSVPSLKRALTPRIGKIQ